jgi:folate-binding protein YgfZ
MTGGPLTDSAEPLAARTPPSPDEEYRALREGAGFIHLRDLGILSVEGPERVGFLHRMLSQDIQSLKEGDGRKAALLDPKGPIQALLRILVTSKAVLLEAREDSIAHIEATLTHYKVGTPVRFRATPTLILGLMGPRAGEVLRAAGVDARELKEEGHGEFHLGEEVVRVSWTTDLPGGGFCLHARPEGGPDVFEALSRAGATRVSLSVVDIRRVETGRPWFGRDITDDNLLHETGLLAEYHSSTKGCYVGQENVARLEARGGHVNKALRGLKLAALVPGGTRLDAGGEDAGWVTTSAPSPRLGPIALAFVRRPWLEPGTPLQALGQRAEVVALPFEDA